MRKNFFNKARILSFLPQTLALLFIFAFAVYAWQESTSPPPLQK